MAKHVPVVTCRSIRAKSVSWLITVATADATRACSKARIVRYARIRISPVKMVRSHSRMPIASFASHLKNNNQWDFDDGIPRALLTWGNTKINSLSCQSSPNYYHSQRRWAHTVLTAIKSLSLFFFSRSYFVPADDAFTSFWRTHKLIKCCSCTMNFSCFYGSGHLFINLSVRWLPTKYMAFRSLIVFSLVDFNKQLAGWLAGRLTWPTK